MVLGRIHTHGFSHSPNTASDIYFLKLETDVTYLMLFLTAKDC